jgi:hypothetical protein
MKPKILSWNVRGLNNGEKRPRIRNLRRLWKVYGVSVSFQWSFISEMLGINLRGHLRVFMVQMPMVIEGFNGMNWLVC